MRWLTLAAAIAFPACAAPPSAGAPSAGASPDSPAIIGVASGSSAGAATDAAPRRFIFTGELREVRSEELRTPLTPTWPIQIRWMAPEGAEVAEGEKVLEFDNAAIASKLDEQELQWNDAKSHLRSREAQVGAERAEKTFAVERGRIELEKARIEAAVPEDMRARRDYDTKRLALEKAQAALASAERSLAAFDVTARDEIEVLRIEVGKAGRSVSRGTESLNQLSLRAPRAGVIVYADHPWEGRKFQIGDDTWPRFTIMKIPDLSAMEVVGWLSDVDDGAVSAGAAVTCVLDTYPDRSFAGRVREVAALAEPRARESTLRVFQVKIDLEKTDPLLMRPGMSVRIELRMGSW